MADTKPTTAKAGWKLARGEKLTIPNLFAVTNKDLLNPNVIKAILRHEANTGHKILGEAIIQA